MKACMMNYNAYNISGKEPDEEQAEDQEELDLN